MAMPMPPPMQSVARPFLGVALDHLVEQGDEHPCLRLARGS
jgi:hypothetical protein